MEQTTQHFTLRSVSAKVLQLLCLGQLLTNESYMDMKSSLPLLAEFEPARGNPNGFLVHRLNHVGHNNMKKIVFLINFKIM